MTSDPTLEQIQAYMWMSGDLRWKLDALQLQIRQQIRTAKAKKICVLSSRQVGKSYWSCTHSLEFLAENPGKISRIVAPTLKQCNDIVTDNLSPLLVDSPKGFINKKKSSYRWELSNGSSLRMGALERAHVDGNRGGNADVVIYEECGFVAAADFTYGVNSVLGPQLLRSNGVEVFVSSPSEDPDHPLHTHILPECEELGTAFRFTVFDSPSIRPDQIAEAMHRSGCVLNGEFKALLLLGQVTTQNVKEHAAKSNTVLSEAFCREYLAEIIRPSTLMVIPGYDAARHVLAFQEPLYTNWHLTVDWGGVRDMTVGLLHTYDYLGNRDLIVDERVFPPNTPTGVIVAELRRMEGERMLHSRWADVAGQTQVDLANEHNYEVQIPQKSDWLASVQAMSVRFTANQILIHPRCTFLRKSCRAGMFNKTRTDFTRDNPELGHCDGLAALMYAVRMQNRDDPYADIPQSRPSNFYFAPKDDAVTDLSSALNPNRFGKFK